MNFFNSLILIIILFLSHLIIKLIDLLLKYKKFIILFILSSFIIFHFNIKTSKSLEINQNVKVIKGTKTAEEQQKIFKIASIFIPRNEGVSYTSYHLKGEYYYENNKKHKLYTICFGNTMIFDEKGFFIRYVKENDKFTKEECEKLFKQQFSYYNKLLYTAMTDKFGTNYYNTLKVNEIVALIDLVWWMGKQGSIYITSASINHTKFRTPAGKRRLIKSFEKNYKRCNKRHQKGCQKRKENIMKLYFENKIDNLDIDKNYINLQ